MGFQLLRSSFCNAAVLLQAMMLHAAWLEVLATESMHIPLPLSLHGLQRGHHEFRFGFNMHGLPGAGEQVSTLRFQEQ